MKAQLTERDFENREEIKKSSHSDMLNNIYNNPASKIEKGGVGSGKKPVFEHDETYKHVLTGKKYTYDKGKDHFKPHEKGAAVLNKDDRDIGGTSNKLVIEKSTTDNTPGKETLEKSEINKAFEVLGI